MKINNNVRNKWFRGALVGACLLFLMTEPTVAQEVEYIPIVAFEPNNNQKIVFDKEMATPISKVGQYSPVIINGEVYIALRSVAEIFEYELSYDSATAVVTLIGEGKMMKFDSITFSSDLGKSNTYVSMNGISYTKVKDFAAQNSMYVNESEGSYLIYKKVEENGTVNNEEENENFIIYENGDLSISESLAQMISDDFTIESQDYFSKIVKAYDRSLYQSFVNPYVAYSYEQMMTDIEKLRVQYPEYIKVGSAGSSVEGRDIPNVEFGNGPTHIYVIGSHHAREYVSTTYIMKFINETAMTAKFGEGYMGYDPQNILSQVTYHILPMINPDGVNLVQNGIDSVSPEYREALKAMPFNGGSQYGYKTWKANIRGVDLNRNYPVARDKISGKIKSPSSSGYAGPYGASEPEIQAVINYLALYDSKMVIAVHSQGEVIYWSSPSGKLETVGQKMLSVSGYQPILNNRSKPNGGYLSNYVAHNYGTYEITIELCKYTGAYPYPDANFDLVWKTSKKLLLAIGEELGK